MGFHLREHTADIAVEATADTIDGVFAATADGLAAATADDVPDGGGELSRSLTAPSREAALFDYLEELIYVRDVDGVLPVDNAVSVTETDAGWQVAATARGVPLAAVSGREIKAVTYSEMVLERDGEGWRSYVVFDV